MVVRIDLGGGRNCNCGGWVRMSGTEETERGPRWILRCNRCGLRWHIHDGIFCPEGADPDLRYAEQELLRCVRQLPAALRDELVGYAQMLMQADAEEHG